MAVLTPRVLSLVLLAAGVATCGASQSPTSPSPAGEWRLVWSDEFDGPDGSAPDASRWVFDLGGGGWGNDELQTYTARRENAEVRGGALVITARREPFTGPDGIRREYTSARLKTKGRFEPTYGRLAARMRLPRGQGLWPAFWMLGADFDTAGWPACGEIDIMEHIGREPMTIYGTLHGPGYSAGGGPSGSATSADGRPFAEAAHEFAVEWEPAAIRWYVDGRLYFTRTPADLPAGTRWVFDHPFFVLVNLAVGGGWPGSPDETTTFPQELRVEWVRAWSRE